MGYEPLTMNGLASISSHNHFFINLSTTGPYTNAVRVIFVSFTPYNYDRNTFNINADFIKRRFCNG